jgi:hypothetical protein
MNFKGIVSTILLLFVGVCIVFVVMKESGVGGEAGPVTPTGEEAVADEPPAGAIEAVEPEVIAYYFHGHPGVCSGGRSTPRSRATSIS